MATVVSPIHRVELTTPHPFPMPGIGATKQHLSTTISSRTHRPSRVMRPLSRFLLAHWGNGEKLRHIRAQLMRLNHSLTSANHRRDALNWHATPLPL